jgi:hypothetical protein
MESQIQVVWNAHQMCCRFKYISKYESLTDVHKVMNTVSSWILGWFHNAHDQYVFFHFSETRRPEVRFQVCSVVRWQRRPCCKPSAQNRTEVCPRQQGHSANIIVTWFKTPHTISATSLQRNSYYLENNFIFHSETVRWNFKRKFLKHHQKQQPLQVVTELNNNNSL